MPQNINLSWSPVTGNNQNKQITALHRDVSNFLWVGTTNELLIYDAVKNKWYTPEEKYP